MLEFKGFSKTYPNGKKAADDINIKVEAGDVYGFIGHNGAGKTTCIRAAVGALNFSEGEILINGMSIKEKPIDCKRIIAYIPDNPDIYEHLTGRQYINFIADMYDVDIAERKERIEKYAKEFEMDSNLDLLVDEYSHGMKQKIAIIAALVHAPKLLVLDEPFVGLDPKAAFILKNIISEMCKNGTAVFFSTHVLEVAEKLCNKISIIKNGKIIASGDMESVKGDSSLEEVFLELIEK